MKFPNLSDQLEGYAQIFGLRPYKSGPEYDVVAHGIYFRRDAIAQEIAEILGPANNRSVLDVAAGTGIISTELNNRGFYVTATDISQDFLHCLRKKTDNVATLVSDMNEGFPFSESSFDCLTTVAANRYFSGDGFRKFLSDAIRILKRGGRMVLPVFFSECFCWKGDGIPSWPSAQNIEPIVQSAGFETTLKRSLGLRPKLRLSRMKYIIADKPE